MTDSYNYLYVSQDVNLEDREANLYSVTSQNTSIYKGYLYANAMSTTSYETKYTSLTKLEINSLENIEYVLVTEDVDVINTKEGKEELEKRLEYLKLEKRAEITVNVDEANGKNWVAFKKTAQNDTYGSESITWSSEVIVDINHVYVYMLVFADNQGTTETSIYKYELTASAA